MSQNSYSFLLIISYLDFNLVSFLNLLQNFNFFYSNYYYYHFLCCFNYAPLQKIFQFTNLAHYFSLLIITIIIIFNFFNFKSSFVLISFENFLNQYFTQMQRQLINLIFFYFLLKNQQIFCQKFFFLQNKLMLYATLFI